MRLPRVEAGRDALTDDAHSFGLAGVLLLGLLLKGTGGLAQPATHTHLDALYRLDRLPAFKPWRTVGAVTSYDRTGGNDDGFSGTYSFLRKEGDGQVLAD